MSETNPLAEADAALQEAERNKPKGESAEIELRAIERGYFDNRLIERGDTFMYPRDRKVPKWAQPAEKPMPKQPRPAGDLKPVATQKAMNAKRGVLANGGQNEPLA